MKFSVGKTNSLKSLVMSLLCSDVITHTMHLQTPSYAEHVALGEFYDEISDLVDAFVETYQGKYGILNDYPQMTAIPTDEPIAYLKALGEEVERVRRNSDFPQDTELQNEMDNIANLINRTLYKLRFLN